MAQTAETPETVTIAPGGVSTFATVWTFESADQVRVDVEVLGVKTSLTADGFDVAHGEWLDVGADVTLDVAPPAGARVILWRKGVVEQLEPFGDLEAFRPLMAERAWDRLTRLVQELRAKLDRALTFPIGETGQELPRATYRRETIPVFDGFGVLRVLPAVQVLNEIGIPFADDGAWGGPDDPLTFDDGAFF